DIDARQPAALHDVVAIPEIALARRTGSAHRAGPVPENAPDTDPLVRELFEKLHESGGQRRRRATAADACKILHRPLADSPARPVVGWSMEVQVHGNGLPRDHLQACDLAA